MVFWSLRYHNSDHCGVVATLWGGSAHHLKSYQCKQQGFPLTLSQGEETELTHTFSRLVAECIKLELHKWQGNDWISNNTWALVGQRTALRRVGKLLGAVGRQTKLVIRASLHNNRTACTKGVVNTIEAKLAKGDVQVAFCLLKGWYQAALDTLSCPCPQMMAQQMEK